MNRSRFQYLHCFVILWLTGCQSAEYSQHLKHPSTCGQPEIQVFDIQETKTFKIPVPPGCLPEYGNSQLVGECLFVGHNANNTRFDVFSLCEEKHLYSIPYDKNFVKKPVGFHFHSPDSLLTVEEDPPGRLHLLNRQGGIAHTWTLKQAPVNWKLPGFASTKIAQGYPMYFFSSMGPGRVINHFDPVARHIHLTVNVPGLFVLEDRSDAAFHGVYDLHNETWLSFFGLAPGIYGTGKSMGHELPYAYTSPPFCCVVGDTSYVSYPLDHEVHLFNNKSGAYLGSRCAASPHIPMLLPPLDPEHDIQEEINYIVEGGVYGELFWHDGAKVFSRMAAHPQPLQQTDGRQRVFEDKSCSIMLFDAAMNMLGEFQFSPDGLYSGTGGSGWDIKSLGTPNGILAALRKDRLENDDHLVYQALLGLPLQAAKPENP